MLNCPSSQLSYLPDFKLCYTLYLTQTLRADWSFDYWTCTTHVCGATAQKVVCARNDLCEPSRFTVTINTLCMFYREGAGTFRKYLILGWGGVVGGYLTLKIVKFNNGETKLGIWTFIFFRKYPLKEEKKVPVPPGFISKICHMSHLTPLQQIHVVLHTCMRNLDVTSQVVETLITTVLTS